MDHEIYPDPYLLKLWIHCLLKASHTEREQLVGRQVIRLEIGQFVTGRDALAREYNAGAKKQYVVSSRTLWRWILLFEELQMLSIKSTTKYSVVTVFNWSEYQCNVQRVSNKRPSNDQQVSTNNNVNNVNKKEIPIQQAEQFDSWWNLYGKKVGRVKCEPKFKQLLKKYEYSIIEEGTKRYLYHLKDSENKREFVPAQKNPLTFLNGEHFNDEYEQPTSSSGPVPTERKTTTVNKNLDEED